MRNLNTIPDGANLPEHLCPPEIATDVFALCWEEIIQGEDDFAYRIPEEFDDLDDDQADAIAEYVIELRRTQQEGFGNVQTNLALAFSELEDHGILTSQICEHTVDEGYAALLEEAEEDPERWHGVAYIPGVSVQNYASELVYRMMPESEDAHEAPVAPELTPDLATFSLAYAAILTPEEFELTDEEYTEIFNTRTTELMNSHVIPALEKHGITVQWSGSPADLAEISNVEFYEPI